MAEPGGRVYADATALIGLARIDRLDLLELLSTPTRVTRYVWDEATSDPTRPGTVALREARARGLLAVVDEGDPDAFPGLDHGESSVLSAAAAVHATAILDERKARALAVADPSLVAALQHVTGILGLILLAKRRGLILAVRPLLDDLIDQHFWIGPSLYQDVLREAGE